MTALREKQAAWNVENAGMLARHGNWTRFHETRSVSLRTCSGLSETARRTIFAPAAPPRIELCP
ncbi:hypothetical protein BOO71_0003019 [Deinococcus marmoris]|uniref:Uncharacterized protein n=1 Tax=Deinococcus marmoris TaxID=249408 RepID=A0A1U7P2M7_9DEIO|nr:hypothetical protein BOO71_0003019 [Deinococcus marmoris]